MSDTTEVTASGGAGSGTIGGGTGSNDNRALRSDGIGGFTAQASDVVIDDSGRIGTNAATPTHSCTIPSTGTGVAFYNTADQTTNYERILGSWATNIYTLYSEKGGTGTQRAFRIGASNGYIELATNGSGTYTFGGAALTRFFTQSAATFQFANSITTQTTAGYEFTGLGSLSATSGTQTWFKINPTLNQASGTAATDILRIEPTLTAVGSGGVDLISAAPGGTEVFRVTSAGTVVSSGGRNVSTTSTSSTNYTVAAADHVVLLTSTSARTVNLPAAAASSGRVLHIKDQAGNAGTNNVTIDGNAAETIDGAATNVISTNYGSRHLVCDGTAWYTL